MEKQWQRPFPGMERVNINYKPRRQWCRYYYWKHHYNNWLFGNFHQSMSHLSLKLLPQSVCNHGQLNIVTPCHTDQFAEWTRCCLLSGRRFNRGLSSAFISHTNRHDSTSTNCWHKYPFNVPETYSQAGVAEWLRALSCSMLGSNPTDTCGHVCRYVDWKGLSTMLSTKRLTGVTGESEKSIGCRREGTQVRDPPWLWNLGQTSPEVQNRGISGPRERTCPLTFFKKNVPVGVCKGDVQSNEAILRPHNLIQVINGNFKPHYCYDIP